MSRSARVGWGWVRGWWRRGRRSRQRVANEAASDQGPVGEGGECEGVVSMGQEEGVPVWGREVVQVGEGTSTTTRTTFTHPPCKTPTPSPTVPRPGGLDGAGTGKKWPAHRAPATDTLSLRWEVGSISRGRGDDGGDPRTIGIELAIVNQAEIVNQSEIESGTGETKRAPEDTTGCAPRQEKSSLAKSGVGGASTRLDRSSVLEGAVEVDTVRDVVSEALAQDSTGWAWDRDALHEERAGLKPMQVRGQTEGRFGFTFHDAFAGIGGSSLGFTEAGGTCVGAFESKEGARQVYASHQGRIPGGSLEDMSAAAWGPADVFVSSCPGQGFTVRGKQCGDCELRETLMWEQLRLVEEANGRYQVLVFEQVPHFTKLANGTVARRFYSRLQELGYTPAAQTLYAPDFGSASARRRLWIVAVKASLHDRVGDFVFPVPSSRHHPLTSVLEPTFFRKGTQVRLANGRKYTAFECPKQRNSTSLRQLGYVGRGGEGCKVYCPTALASTQRASGQGPGWTSGLYLVEGRVTRLTVREVARLQQFEDSVKFPEDETEAKYMLGNSTPVGMARAVGLEVAKYLAEAGLATTGTKRVKEPAGVRAEGDLSGEEGWRREGEDLAMARHVVRMIALQASHAAAAAALRCAAVLPNNNPEWGDASAGWVAWERASGWNRVKVRELVRRLHWRRWLKLQREAGAAAVKHMEAGGCGLLAATLARASVTAVMDSEEARGPGSCGAVRLLWWNWPEHMWEEVREGYKLVFVKDPASFRGDNYESADCEKVYSEFRRMRELGYMEGPYTEEDAEAIRLVNSISAVPKKGTDKLRVVTDMTASGLNDAMIAARFILTSVEEVAADSYAGCWYLVTDLADGFYCQTLHPDSRPYLGVRNPDDGLLYRYTRLPMGLAVSPHNFSRKVAIMVREALGRFEEFKPVRFVTNDSDPHMPRVYGVNARGEPVASLKYYVDDGIVTGPTKEVCLAAYRRLAWFLEARLGLRLNRRKTVGPAQAVPFLGLELDSIGKDVGGACTRLSGKRRAQCLEKVETFIREHAGRWGTNRRELAGLVGELLFASRAVSAGRTFLSRLYKCMSEAGEAVRGPHHEYDREVRLTKGAWRDLQWWQQCLQTCECVRKWRTRTFALQRLWTDASGHGYCDTMAVPGEGWRPAMAFGYGVWDQQHGAFSSNWHELATIVISVAQHLQELRGSKVHYFTDNTTAEAAVNNGVVNSPELMDLVRELRLLQAQGDVEVEAFHLAGKLIVAQGTDGGSRQVPFLGQLGADPVGHDTYDPTAWPAFQLTGELGRAAANYRDREGVVVCSEPSSWPGFDPAGKDTYWHLQPQWVATVLSWLLEAQLRQPDATAFTVVVPMVSMRSWRKYLKHFRRKKRFKMEVEGLGTKVAHLLMRYEAGDAMLGKQGTRECEVWHDEKEAWEDLVSDCGGGGVECGEVVGEYSGEVVEYGVREGGVPNTSTTHREEPLALAGVRGVPPGHAVGGTAGVLEVRQEVPLVVLPGTGDAVQARRRGPASAAWGLPAAGLCVRGLSLPRALRAGAGFAGGLPCVSARPHGDHRRVPPGCKFDGHDELQCAQAGGTVGRGPRSADDVSRVETGTGADAGRPPGHRVVPCGQVTLRKVQHAAAVPGRNQQLLPAVAGDGRRGHSDGVSAVHPPLRRDDTALGLGHQPSQGLRHSAAGGHDGVAGGGLGQGAGRRESGAGAGQPRLPPLLRSGAESQRGVQRDGGPLRGQHGHGRPRDVGGGGGALVDQVLAPDQRRAGGAHGAASGVQHRTGVPTGGGEVGNARLGGVGGRGEGSVDGYRTSAVRVAPGSQVGHGAVLAAACGAAPGAAATGGARGAVARVGPRKVRFQLPATYLGHHGGTAPEPGLRGPARAAGAVAEEAEEAPASGAGDGVAVLRAGLVGVAPSHVLAL